LTSKWQDPIRRAHELEAIAKKSCTLKLPARVTELFRSDSLTYFEAKEVLHHLEDAEGSTAKNMFGQYNATHLRNWYAAIKAWEKDNAYLGEGSRLLGIRTKNKAILIFNIIKLKVQWASHECPALRKTLTSAEKLISDLTRKYIFYI